GFATPAQVLTAAAAGLVDGRPDSLLDRLETSGALSPERRKILEALAEQAGQARQGGARAGAQTMLPTLAPPTRATGAPPAAASEVPLERPGQYTRLHELGRGSQSVVRAARDEVIGREVALKEMAPRSAVESPEMSSKAARSRFLREVRLVAALDHPGIVA